MVTIVGKVEQKAFWESESCLDPSHGCLVCEPVKSLEANDLVDGYKLENVLDDLRTD